VRVRRRRRARSRERLNLGPSTDPANTCTARRRRRAANTTAPISARAPSTTIRKKVVLKFRKFMAGKNRPTRQCSLYCPENRSSARAPPEIPGTPLGFGAADTTLRILSKLQKKQPSWSDAPPPKKFRSGTSTGTWLSGTRFIRLDVFRSRTHCTTGACPNPGEHGQSFAVELTGTERTGRTRSPVADRSGHPRLVNRTDFGSTFPCRTGIF